MPTKQPDVLDALTELIEMSPELKPAVVRAVEQVIETRELEELTQRPAELARSRVLTHARARFGTAITSALEPLLEPLASATAETWLLALHLVDASEDIDAFRDRLQLLAGARRAEHERSLREILIGLLTARFGVLYLVVEARIMAAPVPAIERYCTRLCRAVAATTLEAILGDAAKT